MAVFDVFALLVWVPLGRPCAKDFTKAPPFAFKARLVITVMEPNCLVAIFAYGTKTIVEFIRVPFR